MHVILESPDTPDTAPHDQSMRRIRSAMRGLNWLVAQARVRLSDAGGAVDKRCEVELLTDAGEAVVVTSVARDWHSALQSALSRASRSLLHRWQQEQRAQRKVRKPEKTEGRPERRMALRLDPAGA